MTVRRYLLIIAAAWFVAGFALVLRVGGWELVTREGFVVLSTRDGLAMLLGVPIGLSLASVFGTLVAMTRFPGFGGASYFGPTVLNVFLLLLVSIATLGVG